MSSTSIAVRSSKRALRANITKGLQTLTDPEVERQTQSVICRLFELEVFRRSKNVSCYLSMKGEVNTSPIVNEILDAGKRLYVPNIANREDGRMDMLEIYSKHDLISLPSGKWGIREPGPEWDGYRRTSALDDDAEALDVILVPGVAFDRTMSRLGHGKGYYDFFINEYASRRPKPSLSAYIICWLQAPSITHALIKVGLALTMQMVDNGIIPMAEHDRRMDYIACPEEVIRMDSET